MSGLEINGPSRASSIQSCWWHLVVETLEFAIRGLQGRAVHTNPLFSFKPMVSGRSCPASLAKC